VCARVCNHPCESRCRAGRTGGKPIAIRDLKRFVTDRADPSIYKPVRIREITADSESVAVIGAGPAGLAAAHHLNLLGYKVTILEAEDRLGGVLVSGIPAYRLPREKLKKEFASLIDSGMTVKFNQRLGKDFTIDSLKQQGFKAVFVAIGSHKSLRLGIDGEDSAGVFTSMEFLKSYNLHGKETASGHVGIIGGGNSSPDAARIALRQKGVKSVTIFYRRSRDEMPVFAEEIEAALQEGVKLVTMIAPKKVVSEKGKLSAVEFVRNELGEADASGRRKPVEIKGSEHVVPLDTLIVAISEKPDTETLVSCGLEKTSWETLKADPDTLATGIDGVFAGGDVVTGPKTVVDALAAGKKAAVMIDRYLNDEDLYVQPVPAMPKVFIEQKPFDQESMAGIDRPVAPVIPVEKRWGNTEEIELSLSEKEAVTEACRCLRCDLEFTMPGKA
jgi:NADH-quinone oxidoreductase subunit F